MIAPVGDQGRAATGEAGDAVDACGLNGLGEGPRGQDGGEPPCELHGDDLTLAG